MPHLIIDGYNFIRRVPRFVEAEREGLQSGRYALLLALEEYAARWGYRVTVVFDGGSRPAHMDAEFPREDKFAGIDIIYSERGQSADTAIVRFLESQRKARERGEAHPDDGDIVITDDFGIRDDALGCGAFVKSTEELFEAIEGDEHLKF
jgi:predicted RNA-binding protein with PIN domain